MILHVLLLCYPTVFEMVRKVGLFRKGLVSCSCPFFASLVSAAGHQGSARRPAGGGDGAGEQGRAAGVPVRRQPGAKELLAQGWAALAGR